MNKIPEGLPPSSFKSSKASDEMDAKKALSRFSVLADPADTGGLRNTPVVNVAALVGSCANKMLKISGDSWKKFRETEEKIEKEGKEDHKTKADRKEHIAAVDQTKTGKKRKKGLDWYDLFILYLINIRPQKKKKSSTSTHRAE